VEPVTRSSAVPQLAEHLFRHESARLVSMLTGIFGINHLQLAEDVVQEALGRALQSWPFYGVPENPSAWLMQTAKNLALDSIRRQKRFHEKQADIEASLDRWSAGEPSQPEGPMFENELRDRHLRLMFACCHPQIPQESRTALALKTLCGFGVTEIAHAYLTSEAAIAKRLTRARQRIQEQGIPFEIPEGEELAARLDGVLQILYLLFNEGYKASSGENLMKEDMCREAIRLATLIAEHPVTATPRSHALLALMLLNAARLPSRIDEHGNVLRLQEQDRALWDRSMIGRGMLHLARSASGEDLSEYHLQAGIAACHSAAPDFSSTDWPRILAHYDRWMHINPSPVVALNRAVAIGYTQGPQAGIHAVERILAAGELDSYYLLHSVLADFEERLQRFEQAAAEFRKAIRLAHVSSEKAFLAARLNKVEALGSRKRIL
jgi:RNA polymerase sigma factor (sigma-70 family)